MTMENPLHWVASDPGNLWSSGNVSEAIPGVSTALNWSFIGDPVELASRRAFASLGVLRRDEIVLRDRAEDRFMVCFYGRTTANIEAMRTIGDRMPGTSANAMEAQLFGSVRPGAENHDTLRRLPAIAACAPRLVVGMRRRQLALRAEIETWWRRHVGAPPHDLSAARALLRDARERYTRAFELGLANSMLVQALYDQIAVLAPDLQHRLVTGYSGMVETRMLADLWALAHDQLDQKDFLLRHGYHGPDEGQLSGFAWRERPAPVEALAARFAGAARPDDTSRMAVRETAERELLQRLPAWRRPGARLLLGLARQLIPMREVGKANYTQALDGARLAARAAGGHLGLGEDVFHLTFDEVLAGGGPAAERRALREDYLTTTVPDSWTGAPPRLPLEGHAIEEGDLIAGVAAGGGAVTGVVRIVHDPDEDLDPGEILVCRSTDPGWVPLFHLASGIVVDLGGQMSHGAIVARELGLPCVTAAVDATRRLKTGDRVRLDGDTGRVEILERSVAV